MLPYIVAIAVVVLLAYYVLRVPLRGRAVGMAVALFLLSSFIWSSVAEAFGVKPVGVLEGILYATVAFLLFWVLWLKFGRAVG